MLSENRYLLSSGPNGANIFDLGICNGDDRVVSADCMQNEITRHGRFFTG